MGEKKENYIEAAKKAISAVEIIQEDPAFSKIYHNKHKGKSTYKTTIPAQWATLFQKEIEQGKARMKFTFTKSKNKQDSKLTAELIIDG